MQIYQLIWFNLILNVCPSSIILISRVYNDTQTENIIIQTTQYKLTINHDTLSSQYPTSFIFITDFN